MDYEKKYKEALQKIRELIEKGRENGWTIITYEKEFEEIFPELKEDERIRKELIDFVKSRLAGFSQCEKMIDWLEKQGQTFTQKDVDDAYLKGVCDTKQELEKQGEQKPDDKVEPKFKTGDWVIDKQGIVHQIANVIEIVTCHTYGYDIVGGGYFNDNTEGVRLWTIQDAKDGDVLATSAGAFIYNGNNGGGSCPGSYCGINTLGRFKTGVEHHWTGKKVYPATKEQKEILFMAMKDAGYEFDFAKKELKRNSATLCDV